MTTPLPLDDAVAVFGLDPLGPPPRPDHALVVTAVHLADGTRVPCPAAPLLLGALLRQGVPAQAGPARLASGTAGAVRAYGGAIAGDGGAPTLVAAAVPGGPAEPAVRRVVELAMSARAESRTVLLAAPRSFCAGVERAIEVVRRAQRGGVVYVRRQIVHNTSVVRDLERRGAVFVEELDQVPDGATVVFSAHGVAPAVRAEADRRGLDVIDATCPLVAKVHAEARRFAAHGETVVLVGHAGHEEVEGTLGEAPDATVLVESVADVDRIEVADPTRVSYLTQTTLAVDETEAVVDALRRRFPALSGPAAADICYATTNRQDALTAVAVDAELVLAVGSTNSSNSVRLVELARRTGTEAHLVDHADDVDLTWLPHVRTVGLTAGASAPPSLVDDVIAALAGLGPVHVTERVVTREDVAFSLPKEVSGR